uniref:Acyl-coenzyme A thioesterase 8 n=1 Tax=Parastrongyloides trichosuri TaxID=131310 RepID=A0A0N4ZMC5_PARTI
MSISADGASNSSKDPIDDFFGLDKVSDNIYKTRKIRTRVTANIAYGGQIFTNAISAAEETVDSQMVPHSCHNYFIKIANDLTPIYFHVDRIRDGASFATRYVKAIQNNEIVSTAQVSFHKKESAPFTHQEKMPDVPEPEKLLSSIEFAENVLALQESGKEIIKDKYIGALVKLIASDRRHLFESRPVDPEQHFCLKKYLPPIKHFMWVKSLYPLGNDLKKHRAMMNYISDASLASAGYLGHLSHGFIPSMIVSLDHNIYIHTDNINAEEWILYESYSTTANNSRVLAHGKFWSRSGKLLATTVQECLVREAIKSKK